MISMFDILFIGAVALIVLYFYLTRNRNYWKKRGITSDKPKFIFGSMMDAMFGKEAFGEIFNRIYYDHPGKRVVGYLKFSHPGLVIRDPEIIRKILINDFYSFRNNDVYSDEEVDPIMGRNLFVLKDDLWKKSRALITPAFSSGKIKAMYPGMIKVAGELVEYIRKHPEELHVKNLISRYTSEVVAHCGFGIDGRNFKDETPKMHEVGKLIFQPDTKTSMKMLAFFMAPSLIKLFRLKMVSDSSIQFFESILKDVIVYRQEHNEERTDLVQYLIELKRKTIEVAKGTIKSDIVTRTYSDYDVLAGCVTFFVEGYETSALITNNVLYHLAKHKDVQEKLRQEVHEAMKKGGGEISYEDLHQMNYLHSVYAESNRILPPMYGLQKVCTEKYNMDIGESKPLVIEEGTSIYIPVYSIQNDPLYWDDPESFKPERFLNKEDEAAAKAKGLYMPFGDGPRMCPGARISSTIIKLAVCYVVANFEILPTSKTPKKIEQDPKYFMIGHKGGIYLRFAEISS